MRQQRQNVACCHFLLYLFHLLRFMLLSFRGHGLLLRFRCHSRWHHLRGLAWQHGLQICLLRLPKLEILLFQMRCGQIGLMRVWAMDGWDELVWKAWFMIKQQELHFQQGMICQFVPCLGWTEVATLTSASTSIRFLPRLCLVLVQALRYAQRNLATQLVISWQWQSW